MEQPIRWRVKSRSAAEDGHSRRVTSLAAAISTHPAERTRLAFHSPRGRGDPSDDDYHPAMSRER